MSSNAQVTLSQTPQASNAHEAAAVGLAVVPKIESKESLEAQSCCGQAGAVVAVAATATATAVADVADETSNRFRTYAINLCCMIFAFLLLLIVNTCLDAFARLTNTSGDTMNKLIGNIQNRTLSMLLMEMKERPEG